MNYGIPTLMEFPEAETLARFCAEHGFGFVEMNMTFPWFQAGTVDADKLLALKKKYGIGWTIHLNDQVNPFEFSPEMRNGSLENVSFALELARVLDAARVTMHLLPGTYSAINGTKTYLYGHCKDRYLALARSFRDFAEARLKDQNAVLCIENTSGYQPFQQDAIELLLASEQFGLTFDIGHCFKAGGGDEPFILAHGDRLRHFHIHDCSVKSNHLAFGAGGLDLPRYIRMADRLGCSVVAEVKESGALLQSKAYLMENGLWQG